MDDMYYMKQALREAEKAISIGEIPVGAVIVAGSRMIARAHNMTQLLQDVTAHAEMQAFTAASNAIGGKYLGECTLYVTLEPCLMCAGASYWTQIGRIVYGASDPRRGFMKFGNEILHPKTEVSGGVLAEECGAVLSRFFVSKR